MKNIMRRHLTDFQQYLQPKAIEGYPEQSGPKQVIETESACIESLAKKSGCNGATI
jgi:hypothetical protein